MELKKQILEKDPTAISTFVDQMWWNKGMNHIDCFQAVNRMLSVSLHKYGNVCGERDGVEFAKRRRRDVTVHRGGGATKKSMPSRRHPSG